MAELITTTIAENQTIQNIGPIAFVGCECQFWSWSPYDKCSFRCVYCSVEAQGKSKPAITVEEIGPLLDDYIRLAGDKYPLILGGPSDAYPEEEREHQITRYILEEFAKRKLRFVLVTHGDMLVRDIDLLKKNPRLDAIGISVPHANNDNVRKYESGAPTFEARVKAVHEVYEAGLPVHVNISPWIPGVTEVEKIAREMPADIVVNVGPLSYNQHQREMFTHLFGRIVPSAQRVFGEQFPTQTVINEAYLEDYRRIGPGQKGNLRWLVPPGSGKNYTNYLPNPFRRTQS